MRALVGVLAIGLLNTSGIAVRAAERLPSNSNEAASTFDPRWLRDLKSDEFRVREEACEKIADAGIDAIEPLRKAAESMDRESAARSLGVLERMSRDPVPETAKMAREALSQLEASVNPAVAEIASAALVKSEKLPSPASMRFPNPVFGARNVPQMFNPGGAWRKSTTVINGVRTVTLVENGVTTVVRDNNGKDIVVQVTETVNGAEKTTEYRGADAAELRKQSPAGADVYERVIGDAKANPQIEKMQADARERMERMKEATTKQMDAVRELSNLRRQKKEGTEEYEAAQKRYEEARDGVKKALQR